jgi:GntR family transcriptional activator of glc operon
MPVQTLRSTLHQRIAGSDRVAATLRQQIVDGVIPAGERLPDERSLASELGVARVTVRTALTLLQGEGLLERTQGRGTTVRPFLEFGDANLLTGLLNSAQGRGELEETAREFLAVRRHLAGAVLERIPHPFTARDAAPLRDALSVLRAAIDEDAELELIVAADLLVAQALIAASKSAVLQLIFNPISATLRQQPTLAEALYQRPAENLRAWKAMLTWCQGRSRETTAILETMKLRDETTLKRMRSI